MQHKVVFLTDCEGKLAGRVVLLIDTVHTGDAGDRRGSLICWDVASSSQTWSVTAAHEGHITGLTWQYSAAHSQPTSANTAADLTSSNCVLSGGQDGCVRVWDGRSGSCVAEQAVHVDKKGKGAVGNIIAGEFQD